MKKPQKNTVKARYARAFTEWLRRYNANPVAFRKEYGTPKSYGEGCASYLMKLMKEDAT